VQTGQNGLIAGFVLVRGGFITASGMFFHARRIFFSFADRGQLRKNFLI